MERKRKRKEKSPSPIRRKLDQPVNSNPDLIGFIRSDLYPKFYLANWGSSGYVFFNGLNCVSDLFTNGIKQPIIWFFRIVFLSLFMTNLFLSSLRC